MKRRVASGSAAIRRLCSSKRYKMDKEEDTAKKVKNYCKDTFQQLSLMSLPAEMITHIMSFLSLDELEVTMSVSNHLHIVVKHTLLEDLLCIRCKNLMDQNHAILARMISTQNQHIDVLKKLVAFYQGEVLVPKKEVEELKNKQATLFEKEKEYCVKRDTLQKELYVFTKKFGKYAMLERLNKLLYLCFCLESVVG